MADPATAAALHLAALVQSSDDAIISKDLNGVVTSWNRGAERIFGYTADEMIGRSIATLIPADRMSEETEVLSRIRRGESVDHFETIRCHKDGTLIPISLTVSPIRAPNGTIVGASKIARDITERRRAEAALAAAEARQDDLRQRLMALVARSGALFESPRLQDVLPAIIALAQSLTRADGYAIWRLNVVDGIWEAGAASGVSDEFVRNITRLSRGSVAAGVPFADTLVVEDVSTHPLLQDRQHIYRAEGIVSMLAVPLSIAGAPRETLVLYYRSRHAFDDVDIETAHAISNLGAAAITTAELYDEQRRSRDEASKAYRQANEASRAKDEFLATLSHELRTPLNAVLGWTRMLRAGVVPPARLTRAIEVIERNAAAQLRLVEDMLDLSRIITGNLRLNVQPTHLSSAIEAAVETMLPAANAKEIAVHVDVDPLDLVMGDTARLQQVVWNLLSNAVKFTPKGGRITISARHVASESAVEIEVADTGEGIDAAVLPYVFDRFRQGNSGSARTHTGLGLGLAIARHIMEMHGGHISVQSEGKDKGSAFRLSLPAATREQQLAASDGPVMAVKPVDGESNANLHGMLAGVRALVVDDDPDARELLTDMLQARGVRVRSAASAREGLAALESELPDIILSDLAMPEEDGYDLIRAIRERPADSGGLVPAIAVTAYARPEDETRSLLSGFQVHLTKPIDPVELISAVERLMPEHLPRVIDHPE
jgi:PAS domain S-box-containing protein